ncbi:OLC1v1005228C1 [Oldenlandia corymbosa var. corymbosa]|uniref:OLC1v1005228C1 n=1 Tax=Oldenlandia corymbosa var. corymbosa TaxID=529605 RepID=A0AAV1DHK3_OLDCO|nr:OLC1v1005228C1 [Oldenlandia corymbosa var. corymbosa]
MGRNGLEPCGILQVVHFSWISRLSAFGLSSPPFSPPVMADELAALYSKLSLKNNRTLTEKQIPPVKLVASSDAIELAVQGVTCLVTKVLGSQDYSCDALLTNMIKTWHCKETVEAELIGKNQFLLSFNLLSDEMRVLEGAPWTLYENLLVIVDYKGDISFNKLRFTNSPLWVHVFNVSAGLMTHSTAEFVANKIGSFMDVQTNAQGNCWGISIRVKVLVDITKPIPRMLEVDVNDEPLTLYFQYEKLPIMCFFCEKIGHLKKECDDRLLKGIALNAEDTWGAWLMYESNRKKSPASGRLRSAAEAKFQLESPNQHPNSTTIGIHSQTESPQIRPDPTKQSNLTIQIPTTSNPIQGKPNQNPIMLPLKPPIDINSSENILIDSTPAILVYPPPNNSVISDIQLPNDPYYHTKISIPKT